MNVGKFNSVKHVSAQLSDGCLTSDGCHRSFPAGDNDVWLYLIQLFSKFSYPIYASSTEAFAIKEGCYDITSGTDLYDVC